jgi:hypothetical protein
LVGIRTKICNPAQLLLNNVFGNFGDQPIRDFFCLQ